MKAAYFALLFEPSKAGYYYPDFGGFGGISADYLHGGGQSFGDYAYRFPSFGGGNDFINQLLLTGGGRGRGRGLTKLKHPSEKGAIYQDWSNLPKGWRLTDRFHTHEDGGDDKWLEKNNLPDLKLDDTDDVKESFLREAIHFSATLRLFLKEKKKLSEVINVSIPTQTIIGDLWDIGPESDYKLDANGVVNDAWQNLYKASTESGANNANSVLAFADKYELDNPEALFPWNITVVRDDLEQLYNEVLHARLDFATSTLPHEISDDINGIWSFIDPFLYPDKSKYDRNPLNPSYAIPRPGTSSSGDWDVLEGLLGGGGHGADFYGGLHGGNGYGGGGYGGYGHRADFYGGLNGGYGYGGGGYGGYGGGGYGGYGGGRYGHEADFYGGLNGEYGYGGGGYGGYGHGADFYGGLNGEYGYGGGYGGYGSY